MMWGATEDLKNAAISFIFFSLGTLGSDYMYFKFSDEHPRLFHKGVIPGVYTRRQYNTDWEKWFDDIKLLITFS